MTLDVQCNKSIVAGKEKMMHIICVKFRWIIQCQILDTPISNPFSHITETLFKKLLGFEMTISEKWSGDSCVKISCTATQSCMQLRLSA